MSSSSSSLLSQAAIGRRADALVKAMSTDYLLREQFVTNPSQVLLEFVTGKSLQPERATAINQVIYAVMSNPGLVRWLRHYPTKTDSHKVTAKNFSLEFAQAVVKNGAYPVVLALPGSSGAGEGDHDMEKFLLPIIFAGTDRLAIEETEQSGTGTEMSTGTGTGTGTEVSGTGTEHSGGIAGIFGSRYAQITIEALALYATHLLSIGALEDVYFA